MFRKEAIQSQSGSLSGDVFVAVPVAWQVIGFLFGIILLIAALFLLFASYSRVETVTGSITSDKGISVIYPTRQGIIEDLAVTDGQEVPANAELARIRAEESGAQSTTPGAQVAAAIGLQDASLAAQMVANESAVRAQMQEAAAQRTGLQGEIGEVQTQIELQQDLVRSAQADYERAQQIAERGFLSQRDLQVRQDAVAARQQALSQLNQSLANMRASIAEIDRNGPQIVSQAQAQNAALTAARAQVAQQAANTEGARSYSLRAPIAGKVTTQTARSGEIASPQAPLMSILPEGAVLQAELDVPSAAIGFVKPGQEVRLAIDAFPYERFGTVKGRVTTVSASTVNVQGPNGNTVPAYPVRVRLDQQNVLAYGRPEPFVAGMTLTARIVTERQSLLEWLFEPLFAVGRR